jgi:hypothetical protein
MVFTGVKSDARRGIRHIKRFQRKYEAQLKAHKITR